MLPLLVAGLAAQSGQAMFWPALQALYTYFLRYTLLGAAAATAVSQAIRWVIRRTRKRKPPSA